MKNKELNFEKYIPYEIDFQYLEENVEFFLDSPKGNLNKLSYQEIINFFSDKRISKTVKGSFFESFNIDCENLTYTIHCKNLIARQVLAVILNLNNEKRSIWCDWYLYDFNSCNEHPQFIHSFFLVDNGEIQLDNVSISTSWLDKCDPNILVTLANIPNSSKPLWISRENIEDTMPLWSNEEENTKATAIWYYQKFYRETMTGQILIIRENLKLFHSQQNLISKLLNLTLTPCCSSISQAILFSINRKLTVGTIILACIIINKFFKII